MTVDTQARQFADDPLAFFGGSYRDMHTLPADELARLQLAAVRSRFGDLHGRLAVLTAMAEDTGVDRLDSLDDVVPLLFSPEVYKSYPVSLLTSGRFDLLTRWLGRLTT